MVGLLVRSNLLLTEGGQSCFRSDVEPWHSPALLCSEQEEGEALHSPGPLPHLCYTPPPGLPAMGRASGMHALSLSAPGGGPDGGKSLGKTFFPTLSCSCFSIFNRMAIRPTSKVGVLLPEKQGRPQLCCSDAEVLSREQADQKVALYLCITLKYGTDRIHAWRCWGNGSHLGEEKLRGGW